MAGQRLTAEATTTYGLIMEAYDLKGYQIVLATPNLPVRDTQYDVAAKAEGDAAPTRAEFRQMLQRLLVDRFKLQVHREMREIPVYALVVAKNGSRLKEAASDAVDTRQLQVVGRNYEITQPKATTDDIVQWINGSGFIDRPVVNRTGLNGMYDLRLTYTPDIRSNRDADSSPADLSMFTAVQEQLGLRLEPMKAPIEVLVIDSVQRPSEN
jgi:uncharacterized protein (TIGR03435 family)